MLIGGTIRHKEQRGVVHSPMPSHCESAKVHLSCRNSPYACQCKAHIRIKHACDVRQDSVRSRFRCRVLLFCARQPLPHGRSSIITDMAMIISAF